MSSLKEKLLQQQESKNKEKQQGEIESRENKLALIDERITSLRQKKEVITTLQQQLKEHYGYAEQSLSNFKVKKEEISNLYTENEDLLAEEGVNSRSEMLENNPDDDEVVDYKKASIEGREEVSNLANIKMSLKKELPGLDLKFSGQKKEGEETSNRDLAFQQISEYLQSLDEEIINLEKQKYLETPEGKEEIIQEELNDKRTFSQIDNFKYIDNFKLSNDVMKLGEEHDPELVKRVLTKELQGILEEKTLSREDTQREDDAWQSEKEKISEISQATVNLKWAEGQDKYYKQENRDTIDALENDEVDKQEIVKFLLQLKHIPNEDQEQLVIVHRNSTIENCSNKEVKAYQAEINQTETELKNYIESLITSTEVKIDKIGTGLFSSKTKRLQQENRLKYLKGLRDKDITFDNKLAQEYFDDEEEEYLHGFYSSRDESQKKYQTIKDNQANLNKRLLEIKLKVNSDYSLYDQEMTVKELMTRSQQAITEINKYLDNLPVEKQNILEQIKKNEEEYKKAINIYESKVKGYNW